MNLSPNKVSIIYLSIIYRSIQLVYIEIYTYNNIKYLISYSNTCIALCDRITLYIAGAIDSRCVRFLIDCVNGNDEGEIMRLFPELLLQWSRSSLSRVGSYVWRFNATLTETSFSFHMDIKNNRRYNTFSITSTRIIKR